jgi:Branched-chain amino acid transport system / permease component
MSAVPDIPQDTTQDTTHDASRGAAADIARLGRIGLWVGLAILAAAPFIGLYPVFMMKALCYAMFACAFNLLLGYTGLLSFGHAAFLGSAAYATGWLVRTAGWSPELGVLGGTMIAGACGLVVGLIAIRRQGIYFAMVTLAMAQMIYFVFLQAPFTGGEDGLQGVPRGKLFGLFSLADDRVLYYVVLAVFVAVFLFIIRIVHSPYGQVLKAIRENEPRAISLGYDVAEDAGARLRDALGRALVALGRGGVDDAARRHGHVRRAGDRRVHDHRAAELPRRPGRLVDQRDHRRDLRRLRRRVPQRLRRRTAGVAAAAQGALNARARRACQADASVPRLPPQL